MLLPTEISLMLVLYTTEKDKLVSGNADLLKIGVCRYYLPVFCNRTFHIYGAQSGGKMMGKGELDGGREENVLQ